MRVILGLGNPGKKYILTRHNVGFMFIDSLAKQLSVQLCSIKNEYFFSEGLYEDCSFLLVKPTTYVNLTGVAVSNLMNDYNISLNNILFVYDDVNLSIGDVRVRLNGGDGGHNGICSIINELDTKIFTRIRIGIGDNFPKGDLVNYVLGKFNRNEFEKIESSFPICADLAKSFIKGGKPELLNFNSKLLNKQNLKIN